MSSSTVADRLLTSLKNNRYVAVVVVTGTIVIAVAQFSGALRELRTLFWSDAARAPTTYRTLAFDLRTTENALARFAHYAEVAPLTIQAHISPILIAADPVCAAKKSLAELGDTATRAEIDVICNQIQTFKHYANPEVDFDKREPWLRVYALSLAQRISELHKRLDPQS